MYYFLKTYTCVSSKSNKYLKFQEYKFHPLCIFVELKTSTIFPLTHVEVHLFGLSVKWLHLTVIFQRNVQCVDSLPLIQPSLTDIPATKNVNEIETDLICISNPLFREYRSRILQAL